MVNGSGTGDESGGGGLGGIHRAVAAGNPELYRHVALYLQVLRNVLPGRVEQACFHLATQVHAQRYLSLPPQRRADLHRRISSRLQHCCSLLTVEQLAGLAQALEREKQERQSRRQRRLLQRLLSSPQSGDDAPAAVAPGQEGAPGTAAALPPGSVRLDLSPRLDPAALDWSLPGVWQNQAAAPESDEDSAESEEHRQDSLLERGEVLDDAIDPDPFAAAGSSANSSRDAETTSHTPESGSSEEQDEPEEAEESDAAAWMAAVMEGLLQGGALSAEALLQEPEPESRDAPDAATRNRSPLTFADQRRAAAGLSRPAVPLGSDQESNPAAVETEPLQAEPDAEAGAEHSSPWQGGELPHDPVQLLRWLDGLEAALARRLRNLSHALNTDLLQLGLSRGLLPLSLLEAVLEGQVETLSSPANVVRLQLPFGLNPAAPPLQAMAILIRPADLELEEPRMRTCRRRIHQHRQQVRKMAQTYRRLQRRLQAHEAERLWLQDIQASREPRS